MKAEDPQKAPTELTWTALPLRGRPGAVLFLVLLLPGVGYGTYRQSENALVVALSVAFVVVAVAPAILPTTYVLGEKGITVRRLGQVRRYEWSSFRRLLYEKDFVLVSPYRERCFLETFRGLALRFERSQDQVRRQAVQCVLRYLPRQREVCHNGGRRSERPEA